MNDSAYRHMVPHFMRYARSEVLRTQKQLTNRGETLGADAAGILPLMGMLAGLGVEIDDWLGGKSKDRDPVQRFRGKAIEVETVADQLSAQLWQPVSVDISSIFELALTERERTGSSFAFLMRTDLDLQRIRLLEQVGGARLLHNNSDVGDEVERILVQYLNSRLGSSVEAVRGGHIFDMEGNRSDQIDIIVIPSDTLAMCPAGTEEGKYNVLADQVVAAISVKTTLDPAAFRSAWDGLQSIPVYDGKDTSYPIIAGPKHSWPLCFVVGAYSTGWRDIGTCWNEVADGPPTPSHRLQMVMALDCGYSVAGSASWPLPAVAPDCNSGTNGADDELAGCLGLGWLLLALAARGAVMQGRSLSFIPNRAKLLFTASLSTVRQPRWLRPAAPMTQAFGQKIGGVFAWGPDNRCLRNGLHGMALTVSEARLVDRRYPLPEGAPIGHKTGERFESRWFEPGTEQTVDGRLCVTEWVKDAAGRGYTSRTVEFDLATGEEIQPQNQLPG